MDIHSHFGGNKQSYLPMVGGQVRRKSFFAAAVR
jgi:hypothetical protein